MTFVIGTLGTLQFKVKALRKHARQIQGTFHGPRAVALHQRLADSAALRA